MATDYAVVFENVAAGATVTFGCTGRASRFYIDDVVVVTGDERDPTEAGYYNAETRVIPDIDTKQYTVSGLATGATYRYLVVTHFADGVTKKSNLQTVTLLEEQGHGYEPGDVNHDKKVSIDDKVSIADVTALINLLLSRGSD